MAPNHPRSTDDLIARLASRIQQLEGALARGPVLPSYTAATLPANPPTGLEVLVTDLGLRAYWNGTAWIYNPQRIDRRVLATTTGSVTIPVPTAAGFGKLRIAWSARSTDANPAGYMCLQINADSNSHYVWQINQANNASLAGSGNSAGTTTRLQIGTLSAATATAGIFGAGEAVIPGADGGQFKAVTAHSTSIVDTANGYSGTYGGVWESTTAITSLTLFPSAGSFAAGTTISLYGE